jgi:hypothetical protein
LVRKQQAAKAEEELQSGLPGSSSIVDVIREQIGHIASDGASDSIKLPEDSDDSLDNEPALDIIPEVGESLTEACQAIVSNLVDNAIQTSVQEELVSELQSSSDAISSEIPQPAKSNALAIAYIDCFVIFRALCKLSAKEVPVT